MTIRLMYCIFLFKDSFRLTSACVCAIFHKDRFRRLPVPELSPMWETIGEFISKYGPFPAGIGVGIWLTKWAVSQQLKYMEKEKTALRNEKKTLMEYIKAQEERIDKLHDNRLSEKK